jgi:hypothetical protein
MQEFECWFSFLSVLSVLPTLALLLGCFLAGHGIRDLFFGVSKFCMGFEIKKVVFCIRDLV